jgi:transcriptional regulator with XRE-family HTH domain
MKYNEKLRLFFKKKGLSQKEVAEILGHAPAMISRFLSGESNFGPDFIISLVKAFPEIDLKYIFQEEEEGNMISEPVEYYGIKEQDIVKELELIEEKISSIKKCLARKRN